MSAIAILEYGGANELFNQMSALAKKGREDYQLYFEEETPNEHSDIDPMVHSPKVIIRTPSKCLNMHLALQHPVSTLLFIMTCMACSQTITWRPGHWICLLGMYTAVTYAV